MDTRLLHPFTSIVAGPTMAGKTVWVKNLIKHIKEMVDVQPHKILWFYGARQPKLEVELTPHGVTFLEGFKNEIIEEIGDEVPKLVVVDDLMSEISNDKRISTIFTKGCHHRNMSVIFILQNMFYHGKELRTVSLNAQYIVLFKNPRDKSQIRYLGRQMFPENSKYLQEAYNMCTKEAYGYLFIDLKPNTPESIRLRTCVLPCESTCVVFLPS